MRSSRSYQLVSEHSILSAQMKNKVAAMEEFLEKQALHSKPEWKEELDTIKKRLERRRSRCDELSEKDFEIYLEMKLQWLQQYYVTAKSQAPEKKTREPEEDGWNEPDFKVYDRGRGKTENLNSRRRRSREDEFDEKLEEMAEILSSYLSNVAVKSSKSDKERSPELEAVNPETDESEREKNEEDRSSGSHERSRDFVSENRSNDVGSGSAIGELSGTDAKPGKPEEEITSHDSTVTEGGAIKVEAMSTLIDLGEISLSCVTVLCNREKKDEDEESSETMQSGESLPEAPLVGGTATEVWSECEGDERSLSFVGKACDRNWGVNEARADWTSEKIWAQEFPRKVDPDAFTVGQAQVTPMANGQIENSEDDDESDGDEDDDEDDSDDEETPKKAEGSNKRLPESSKKTPVPVKKAKFVTPEKTGGKASVHVATPYPKQAGKAAANDKQQVKQQTPKSGGDYSCKPCNRSFKTEDALGSHNKAKHSAK